MVDPAVWLSIVAAKSVNKKKWGSQTIQTWVYKKKIVCLRICVRLINFTTYVLFVLIILSRPHVCIQRNALPYSSMG